MTKEFVITWDTTDIRAAHPNLSEKKARKTLAFMKEHYDPEYGINWGVIESAIEILGFEGGEA